MGATITAVLVAVTTFAFPSKAHPLSQRSPRASAPASTQAVSFLEGRLLLDGAPADSGTVVLHRVTPTDAGPVDSVRVGEEGRFRFELPELPQEASGEVYFASSRRDGVLYFGSPITDTVPLDSIYTIASYGTRPAPEAGLPFPVANRNLFVDEGPMGWRVTDLIEIRNDSAATWVPGPDEHPVWRYPLPPGARSFRVGDGDLSPDAVRFEDGALLVYSPVPPGEHLYMIQYELEDLEFSLPLPGTTETLEVLMKEPAPDVTLGGLERRQPVQLEPEVFYARWRADDVADRVVRVQRDEQGTPNDPRAWLGVALALVLLGAAIWAVRRTEAPDGPELAAGGDRRREILLEVARRDEEFEALDNPDAEARDRFRKRRAALLQQLETIPPEDGDDGDGGPR